MRTCRKPWKAPVRSTLPLADPSACQNSVYVIYIDSPPCKIHTVYIWRILQGGACVCVCVRQGLNRMELILITAVCIWRHPSL